MPAKKIWDKLIEELSEGLDLQNPSARDKAYEKCISYADKHMKKDPLYNLFLAHAADRLGTGRRNGPDRKDPVPEDALVHMAYDYNEGPVLTANREGLLYLAKLFSELSRSRRAGEEVRLFWDEPPLCGETYGIVVRIEDDEWFEESAADYYSSKEDDHEFPRREITGTQVAAIQFILPLCSSLPMKANKVYLVYEVSQRDAEDVWTKLIRDDDSRLCTFTVRDDEGGRLKIRLDLDDPDINFLTSEDLDQFIH